MEFSRPEYLFQTYHSTDGFILQDTPLQGHSEPLGVLSPDPGVRSLRPPLKDADGEVSPSLTPLPPGWLLT